MCRMLWFVLFLLQYSVVVFLHILDVVLFCYFYIQQKDWG